MSKRKLIYSVIIMMLIAGVCNCKKDSTTEPEPPKPTNNELDGRGGGIILFENESNGDYNFELWAMNADGTAQTKITNTAGYDGAPSFSPDKKKIVFTSTRSGSAQIYVLDFDAYLKDKTNLKLTQLTNSGMNYYPAWAPDNSKIVFASLQNSIFYLYSMNIDGTGIVKLIEQPNSSTAAWSPDSKKIVFVSGIDNAQEIYIVNVDGTNLKKLTNNSVSDNMPAWSPDGTKIAFATSSSTTSYDICVMNVDGSNVKTLVRNSGLDEFPKWSPDGSKLVFRSENQIHIMNADGTNNKTMTDLRGFSVPYDWK